MNGIYEHHVGESWLMDYLGGACAAKLLDKLLVKMLTMSNLILHSEVVVLMYLQQNLI